MPNIVVHTESLRRRWIAPLCSLPSLINFLLVCGAGILPLYIAWGSGPFWLKDVHRYEQPKISFKSRLVVEVSGIKVTTNGVPGAPFTYLWTTSPLANAMIGSEALKAMSTKTSVNDNNLDGLNDEIFISATLPLKEGETVFSTTLVAWFDASLQAPASEFPYPPSLYTYNADVVVVVVGAAVVVVVQLTLTDVFCTVVLPKLSFSATYQVPLAIPLQS